MSEGLDDTAAGADHDHVAHHHPSALHRRGQDERFGDALGGAVEARRLDALVAGWIDQRFDAGALAQTENGVGRQDVGLNRAVGEALAVVHVLGRRQVNDDLGLLSIEDSPKTRLVPHVRQLIGRRWMFAKGSLEAEQGVLVVVEQDQSGRRGGQQRLRQRPADAARGAGDQHAPVADQSCGSVVVAVELRSAEEQLRRRR